MKFLITFFDCSTIIVTVSQAEQIKRAKASKAQDIEINQNLYAVKAIRKIERIKKDQADIFETPQIEAPGQNVVSKETRARLDAKYYKSKKTP